jgi:DNA-binding NtrC family response regulator
MKLMIVDDEKRLREFIRIFCEGAGYEIVAAATPSEALARFARENVDVAVVDVMMPEMDGITLMKKMRDIDPDLETIIITAHGSIETAVAAMREGAADFIAKPFGSQELQAALERTRRFRQLHLQLKHAENELKRVAARDEQAFIGEAPAIRELLAVIDRLAASDATNVLITGESGTGKELLARRLHRLSPRAQKPFHAVNCAAIVSSLFESEFFGHRKGAFTGADCDQPGWFERANGSTLFLDEISEIPPALQAKLLRVLEERTVTRVGETKPRPVDVRILASSNQPIAEAVKRGGFRPDLFYRLAGFHIHIPPLRERPDDIPLICRHFLEGFAQRMAKQIRSIKPEAFQALLGYSFPGNVREVRNLIERACILATGPVIEHFPLTGTTTSQDGNLTDLRQLEEQAIRRAMKLAGNNKTHAAKLLGIHWQVLHRKLKHLGIDSTE